MNLSLEMLEELAGETGFRPEALEKVIRLGEILADFARHRFLAQALVLKGGSALNLCLSAPSRLSVDLDFNYVASPEREQMLRDRPEIERAIEIIAEGQGYRIQKSGPAHAGRKTYLSYMAKSRSRERIEIDLNFMFRIPIGSIEEFAMWQPGDLERPRVRVVSFPELAAGKLCALLERTMPRDLFDTIRLPDHRPDLWKTRCCRRIFVAFAGGLKHPLGSYSRDRVDRVTERQVRQQLDPMVVPAARLSAKELRERTWSVLVPLLNLDEAEQEYIDKIQAGELDARLLFPDDEPLAESLNRHPMLLWRLRNIRQFRFGEDA